MKRHPGLIAAMLLLVLLFSAIAANADSPRILKARLYLIEDDGVSPRVAVNGKGVVSVRLGTAEQTCWDPTAKKWAQAQVYAGFGEKACLRISDPHRVALAVEDQWVGGFGDTYSYPEAAAKQAQKVSYFSLPAGYWKRPVVRFQILMSSDIAGVEVWTPAHPQDGWQKGPEVWVVDPGGKSPLRDVFQYEWR